MVVKYVVKFKFFRNYQQKTKVQCCRRIGTALGGLIKQQQQQEKRVQYLTIQIILRLSKDVSLTRARK